MQFNTSLAQVNSTTFAPQGANFIEVANLEAAGVAFNASSPQDTMITAIDPRVEVFAGGSAPIMLVEDINVLNQASVGSVGDDIQSFSQESVTVPDYLSSGPNGVVVTNLTIDLGTIAEVENLSLNFSRNSLEDSFVGLSDAAGKTFSDEGLKVEPGIEITDIRILDGDASPALLQRPLEPLDEQIERSTEALSAATSTPLVAEIPDQLIEFRSSTLTQISAFFVTDISSGEPTDTAPGKVLIPNLEIEEFATITRPVGAEIRDASPAIGNAVGGDSELEGQELPIKVNFDVDESSLTVDNQNGAGPTTIASVDIDDVNLVVADVPIDGGGIPLPPEEPPQPPDDDDEDPPMTGNGGLAGFIDNGAANGVTLGFDSVYSITKDSLVAQSYLTEGLGNAVTATGDFSIGVVSVGGFVLNDISKILREENMSYEEKLGTFAEDAQTNYGAAFGEVADEYMDSYTDADREGNEGDQSPQEQLEAAIQDAPSQEEFEAGMESFGEWAGMASTAVEGGIEQLQGLPEMFMQG